MRKNKQGFTLVEMSIVLVIIGLLAVGILAGQELVDVAKVIRVVRDVKSYDVAIIQFGDKYNGIPGDFDKASMFFGADSVSGNGNSYLDSVSATHYEVLHVFPHLYRANLIKTGFTEQAYSSYNDAIGNGKSIGTRYALAKTGEDDYFNLYIPASWIAPSSQDYYENIGDVVTKRYVEPTLGSFLTIDTPNNGIKTKYAERVDSKMDDGKPFTGSIQASLSHIFCFYLDESGWPHNIYNINNKVPALYGTGFTPGCLIRFKLNLSVTNAG